MGPGSISAITRVFDALWAGTTEMHACTNQRPAAGYGKGKARHVVPGFSVEVPRWLSITHAQ
jgi:hypothetical protein